MKDILLKQATRDELIEELRKRESISFAVVKDGEGGTVENKQGRISIYDENYIFIIKPNSKTGLPASCFGDWDW